MAGSRSVRDALRVRPGPVELAGYDTGARPLAPRRKREHDFLWRIRRQLPPPGVIGVFDRSHYEDVLVARVHELVPEAEWRARFDVINDFEAELVAGGTTVLKVFLNVGYATQRKRLLKRLADPDKHWKFDEHDIDVPELGGRPAAARDPGGARPEVPAAAAGRAPAQGPARPAALSG